MKLTKRARNLRVNSTEVEKKLWHHLRNNQLNGYKFRRQYPIGNYIADFVCVSLKLIIELDGGQHADQQIYDKKREQYLEKQGYKVIRFWNNDVIENLDGILEALTLALSQREMELK